jgi:site-specific DNA-methyltransferase (adenine-specific)
MSDIKITCEDCMELMARYPDKYFDIAIVDPPYGETGQENKTNRSNGRFDKYFNRPTEHVGHRRTENSVNSWTIKYSLNKTCTWDVAPPPEYFTELFRVSKAQIIWGGNYFPLPPSRNFVIWRKLTISENFTMAMAEYAWVSFSANAKVIDCAPQDTNRFHPTQKPVYLYKKLLQWYSQKGDKILDTHMGSGSCAIACIDHGLDFVGCEIDKEYCDKALSRIKSFSMNLNMFNDCKVYEL